MKPSKRHQKLFQFIETFWQDNHYGPTYDEMCLAVGIKSKSNIKPLLEKLKQARLIDYVDGVPRAIWLISETIRTFRIPYFGRVSAGSPIPQPDDLEFSDYRVLTQDQLPKGSDPKSLYILQVDGDSMMDANIQDRDLVIIDRNAVPREGDTLVFRVHDEQATTLKRYYRDGDYVLLQPANPKYETKRKHRELVESFGKVLQVIRTYNN